MSAPLLIIAAGGTGGHMFPAQALAEEMLARGWRVALASDDRGLGYADGFPEAVERIETPSASFARGGLTARLAVPATILRGLGATFRRFRRDRPAVVIGFGGYPAIPALGAARALGLPRLIHEQNGVLGRVNRLFARHVMAVACGTWPVARAPEGARLVEIGNPVRAGVLAAAATPYAPPGAGRVRVVAIGGSQGARALARLVPAAAAALPEDLRRRLDLTLQARAEEADHARAALAAAGIAAEIAPFFADLPARIGAAQLVVARAGASSLAEIAAIGRPAILVPLPSAMDDHQSANAAALAGAGGAVVTPEPGLTPDRLAAEIAGLLTDPARAAAMAGAARAAACPDAAARLADLVARIAAHG